MTEPSEIRWDVLNQPSAPGFHWTTTNVGEAAPGVLTPMCWSIWRGAVDRGLRDAAYGLGVLSARERAQAEPPLTQVFAGRTAVNVEFLALLGDRAPGTSGRDVVESAFGRIPETMAFHPTRRRYPFVAVRFPRTFRRIRREMLHMATEYDTWWATTTKELATANLATARRILEEATERFRAAVAVQSVGTLIGVQPVYDAAAHLVRLTGTSSVSDLTAVPGGVEMEVVGDIWKASRGELTVEQVAARHGFHGPGEGEVSSEVWRENLQPLRQTVSLYAARPDSEDPQVHAAALLAEHRRLEQQLSKTVGPLKRPAVRAIMSLIRHRVPLRGVAKRSYLQALDVCRGSARRIGVLLAAEGVIDQSDDVFQLTVDNVLDSRARDLRRVATANRARFEHYRTVEIPAQWYEQPEMLPIDTYTEPAVEKVVTGVGVSAGIVEGRARVLESADFAEVEPGEVLVAPFTDPSWSSVMFVSAALVVDIGGALSHTAVVARELQIPCVVNTRTGTRTIRTGDTLRVDGSAGTVEILARDDSEELA